MGEGGRRRYCVTGASGYIGSWLVKLLLESGHCVHAAVRDPGINQLGFAETPVWFTGSVNVTTSSTRCSYLASKWNGGSRLKLFKADLQEEGSFDGAIGGCDGVFHVAAPMELNVPSSQDDIETYVQSNVVDPAVKGTLNLMRSCARSETVKRVVFTSSISTMTAQDGGGGWLEVVDETCLTPVEHVWRTKANGWVYVLTKLLTEAAAFEFAAEHSVDVVSVVTTTVAGPFLTCTVPASVRVLLSPITGDEELFPILMAVSSRMGSMSLVHIEDICNAHLFLMEKKRAEGRYLCCVDNCHLSELVQLLDRAYPNPHMQRVKCGEKEKAPCKISSKKLVDLGFEYKYGSEDIIKQTTQSCVECSYLPPIRNVISG